MSISYHRGFPMIRQVSSIVLNAIAGFFFYIVAILGFINVPSYGVKWAIMAGFMVPALLALCAGLALKRFCNWRKTSGIVLISSSAFTAFGVFTFACLLMEEDFRKMMKPDTLTIFSDYLTGATVIIAFAGLGWMLLKTNKGCVEQGTTLDSATLHK